MKLILTSDYAQFHNLTEPEVYELIESGKLKTKSFGAYKHPLLIYTDQAPEGAPALDTDKEYFTLASTAEALSTTQARIREMVRKKVLNPIKIKGYMFIESNQIQSEAVKNHMKKAKRYNFSGDEP